jgi:hypothetical protein
MDATCEVRLHRTRIGVWWSMARYSVSCAVRRAMWFLGIHRSPEPMRNQCDATGHWIRVENHWLGLRITVNGRDYTWNRLTGEWEGTGVGMCNNRPVTAEPGPNVRIVEEAP